MLPIIPSLVLSSCILLGDSIAQGISAHLPQCENRSFVGITTANWLKVYTRPAVADTVVISLGSNDRQVPASLLEKQLTEVRAQVTAERVVWILCNRPSTARRIVLKLATIYNDTVLDVRPVVGPDHVHPTRHGYRRLARRIQE